MENDMRDFSDYVDRGFNHVNSIRGKSKDRHICHLCDKEMEKMTVLSHEFFVCKKCRRFLIEPELAKDYELYAQAIEVILDEEDRNN